ncbi:3-oxoacyl-[acyl-carrier-protein] synthase III C-terminal domain-containing protein [Streptomyces sp. NPDC005775]|uniref:3-oxoacyl-[acyl-carrier-protein] synthase III C-terminal domain-containing protein n=1 Tax=unclassified Streptomyces TaxID=2593676 RepID=UPI0033F992AC
MNQGHIQLSSPAYELGENETDHSDLPGLLEQAERLGMPPRAELWGWGKVHRTELPLEELAARCGRAVLAGSGTDPADVDALVLCCTGFPGDAETHGGFVQAVLAGLGTKNHDVVGVTLNRCTNLLAGLVVARSLVAGGSHRRVLVLTVDRVTDEARRMTGFALFSDGAAGCLVTDGAGEYTLVDTATAHDTSRMDWSEEISSELSRRVNDTLLTPRGMKPSDIDGVLHTNVFKPVVTMKELQAGFKPAQLSLDNIERVGHCFAADPLINLVDRNREGRVRHGRHYLLAASVPGSRVGVLLQRTPAESGH